MNQLKECTKEELEAFVSAYSRPLVRDVFGACEPPLVTFNDFTLGVWPKSVVASFGAAMPVAPGQPEEPECGWRIASLDGAA